MPPSSNPQFGKKDRKVLIIIILAVTLAIAIGLSIWGITNYVIQKTDVDNRIASQVAAAKKDQADADEVKFTAREKEPNRTFAGPDDFGRLTFKYPKTWSVYVSKEITSGGTYEAYLNPVSVPPVSISQQFALRIVIETKDYDKVIASYETLVKKGDLKSSAVTSNGNNGTRLEGSFSKDIRGSAVIFKIRDKTATIRTDANTFMADFEKIIKTIDFNQ